MVISRSTGLRIDLSRNSHCMTNILVSTVVLCLLLGCTATKRDDSAMAGYSQLPPPQMPASPQVQPAPRGEPPAFVYVSGEFTNPGRYSWTNGMTLKDAIEAAGGFTDFAVRRITLRHWNDSVERFRLKPGWA